MKLTGEGVAAKRLGEPACSMSCVIKPGERKTEHGDTAP